MEAASSVVAAFGINDLDSLNDLANWFDGRVGPGSAGEQGRSGDQSTRLAAQPAHQEA